MGQLTKLERAELKRQVAQGNEDATRALERHRKLDRERKRRSVKLQKEKVEAGDRMAILRQENKNMTESERKRKKKCQTKLSSPTDEDDHIPSEDCTTLDKDDEQIETALYNMASATREPAAPNARPEQDVAGNGREDGVEVVQRDTISANHEIIDLCGSDEDSYKPIKPENGTFASGEDIQNNVEIQVKLEKLRRRKARIALENEQMALKQEQMALKKEEMDIEDEEAELRELLRA